VPGASYWYVHTDQWRYDSYGADKLTCPLGRGRFDGKHTIDLLATATATAMGWSPFNPQFDRSSLDVADEAVQAGRDVGEYVAEQLAQRKLKLAVTDPDNPARQLATGAQRLAVQPDRLMG
jgi:nitrate reductase alpha subunit